MGVGLIFYLDRSALIFCKGFFLIVIKKGRRNLDIDLYFGNPPKK